MYNFCACTSLQVILTVDRSSFLRDIKRQDSFFFSTDVTHIVTEFSDTSAVFRKLGVTSEDIGEDVNIVSTQWFIESMKANVLLDVQNRHKIKAPQVTL